MTYNTSCSQIHSILKRKTSVCVSSKFSVFRFLRIVILGKRSLWLPMFRLHVSILYSLRHRQFAFQTLGCFSMGYSGDRRNQGVGAASVAAQAIAQAALMPAHPPQPSGPRNHRYVQLATAASMHALIHAAAATGPHSPLFAANSTRTKTNRNVEFIFPTVS